jgi:predicted metalloprotease
MQGEDAPNCRWSLWNIYLFMSGNFCMPESVVFHIWLCGNKTRAELEKEDKVRLTVNNPSAKVR